jgi:hypothetical protein
MHPITPDIISKHLTKPTRSILWLASIWLVLWIGFWLVFGRHYQPIFFGVPAYKTGTSISVSILFFLELGIQVACIFALRKLIQAVKAYSRKAMKLNFAIVSLYYFSLIAALVYVIANLNSWHTEQTRQGAQAEVLLALTIILAGLAVFGIISIIKKWQSQLLTMSMVFTPVQGI